MSTRCQIGLYEKQEDSLDKPTVLLYRHCDGYPEAAFKPIERFVKYFKSVRGWDPNYMGARLLCYLISTHTQDLPGQMNGDTRDKEDIEFGGILTYGICLPNNFHGDTEFYYAIYPRGIRVYRPRYSVNPDGYELVDMEKEYPEVMK